jgi:hypothetical protein
LGPDRQYVACDELVQWFFNYFDFPKLFTTDPIRIAIGKGTADAFGYVPAAELVDGELRPRNANSVWFGSPITHGEIELGPGAFIVAPELAKESQPTPESSEGGGEQARGGGQPPPGPEPVPGPESTEQPTHVRVRTTAGSAEQLFRLMPGLQNLADRSKRIVVRLDVDAEASDEYDRAWFRNAVEEHLDEAGVEREIDLT